MPVPNHPSEPSNKRPETLNLGRSESAQSIRSTTRHPKVKSFAQNASITLYNLTPTPLSTRHAIFSSSGGQDATQSPTAAADSICMPSDPLSAARHLELGGAVGAVNGIAERRGVVVAHLRVAAQNRVLGILCCGIGACIGPGGIVLGRLGVLICEEGLVPPINTQFR